MKKKTHKDWHLWHATQNIPIVRLMGPKLDKLNRILKIAFDPGQSSVLNTIVLQFVAQYFMISGSKRLR